MMMVIGYALIVIVGAMWFVTITVAFWLQYRVLNAPLEAARRYHEAMQRYHDSIGTPIK